MLYPFLEMLYPRYRRRPGGQSFYHIKTIISLWYRGVSGHIPVRFVLKKTQRFFPKVGIQHRYRRKMVTWGCPLNGRRYLKTDKTQMSPVSRRSPRCTIRSNRTASGTVMADWKKSRYLTHFQPHPKLKFTKLPKKCQTWVTSILLIRF